MRSSYIHFKQVTDRVVSLILIIVLSWLFLLIIILYVITGNKPVFFVQERIGKNNRPFRLYKFRTLKNVVASIQERRFWLGNLMRYTSLDELPQLINVLRGEMSLIGPRPLPVTYLLRFNKEQQKRHLVMPGITGLAQVNGRNSITWTEKFNFDLYYVNNLSIVLDITIILKTIILLLSFRKDSSLQEKEFTGNNDT
ncbi:MAG TPA: sugar transferase [Cyclobacteriaceae bacterium]